MKHSRSKVFLRIASHVDRILEYSHKVNTMGTRTWAHTHKHMHTHTHSHSLLISLPSEGKDISPYSRVTKYLIDITYLISIYKRLLIKLHSICATILEEFCVIHIF